MKEKFIIIAATGFGSGYAPVAPGTAGTLVGILFYLVLSPASLPLYLLSTVALTGLAIYLAQEAEGIFGKKDASPIVIDEIIGLLWTMVAIPCTVLGIIAGFICFRLLDIVKPFPARTIQDRLPGGYGVVGDDVMAGIYANLILQVLRAFSVI